MKEPEDPIGAPWRVSARQWISLDPDPGTREDLIELLRIADADPSARDRLADLFDGRLAFGTAGLRAPRGPGPRRMNRLVVRQTAAGLADVVISRHGAAPARPVLVGFDGRHLSDVFAHDMSEVLAAAGLIVYLEPTPRPTPFISWVMRQIDAVAAVVVTASHNPAPDSGVKIYAEDGAQIIPPLDVEIRSAIERHAHHDPPGTHVGVGRLEPEWVERYVSFAATVGPPPPPRTQLGVATTALHGVGSELLRRSLTAAGVERVVEVAAQSEPDPDFPTVEFPNPEEAGASDLLLDLAAARNVDLALALDPDADRLAVGVSDGSSWAMLGGDELGALLCEGLLTHRPPDAPASLVVSTVVSSRLAGRIATARGARFVETLTGFKWMCRPGLADPAVQTVLAYEEALGYAIDGLLDKDGISTAVAVTSLCRLWAEEGRHPLGILDDLAVEFGAHVQLNTSIRGGGPGAAAELAAMTTSLFETPPDHLGGVTVEGVDRPGPDVLRLALGDDDRVVIRPSGTEPKLKIYCEAVEPVAPDERPSLARERARLRLEALHGSLRGLLAAG